MTDVFGDRVRLAREVRGLTQTALAERVGVGHYVVARVEAGLHQPPSGLVEAIALVTRFPPSFFRQEPGPQFPLGSLLLRGRKGLTARGRDMARSYAETVYEGVARLLPRFRGFPVLRLPRLTGDPVTAAQVTRSDLGIAPEVPIKHLVHTVERAGVLILGCPHAVDQIDAFSAWAGGPGDAEVRPVIALIGDPPPDRCRWSVAHEVGHLVLHAIKRGNPADLDREADRFAAELLLPETALRRELVPPLTLGVLSDLKLRWRVSMQALIRRAHDLGVLTDHQYYYLFRQLSARGWRRSEPPHLAPPVEKPRAVRRIVEQYFAAPRGGIDYRRMASEFNLTVQMAREIVAAHADRSELPRKDDLDDAPPPSNVRRLFDTPAAAERYESRPPVP